MIMFGADNRPFAVARIERSSGNWRYTVAAGKAKWKFRVPGLWPCEKVFVERHTGAGAPGLDSETWKFSDPHKNRAVRELAN